MAPVGQYWMHLLQESQTPGSLVKGSGQPAVGAATHQTDYMLSGDFVAGAHAQTAQDTILLGMIGGEEGFSTPSTLPGSGWRGRRDSGRAPSWPFFARLNDFRGIGYDDHPFFSRHIARSGDRYLPLRFAANFHQAQAAGAVRGQVLVVAQGRDIDTRLFALLPALWCPSDSLYFFTIDFQVHHDMRSLFHRVTASWLQTSMQTPQRMQFSRRSHTVGPFRR